VSNQALKQSHNETKDNLLVVNFKRSKGCYKPYTVIIEVDFKAKKVISETIIANKKGE
jgi:hypothetical protein